MILLLCLILPLLSSCGSLGYYLQAVRGQADLLARRQPIQELLAQPETPEALKNKLAGVLVMREFAVRELDLPDNASYTSYADLERSHVVWNVFATPEFSLRGVESCFPLVGCLAYRGYFSREAARRHAGQLREQGYDVFLAGVPAYSTLGWFDDPVLNTMLHWPEPYLAGLLFHELAHQRLFLPDDTQFNESFATTVEEAGVRRWLAAGHSPPEQAAAYRRFSRYQQEFLALAEEFRERLQALYARQDLEPTAMRALKQQIFRELDVAYRQRKQENWDGFGGFDFWFESPNNASFLPLSTYHHHVPAFKNLLNHHRGDFAAFYQAVEELAALPPSERKQRMEQWR